MSDLNYHRCPHDDWKAGFTKIGENPDTGKAVELDVNGVASVIALQSAFMTVSAAMKNGHEEDYLEKVALCLFGKLVDDPHALCPVLSICSMLLLMLTGQAGVKFKGDRVCIEPPDVEMDGGDTCMYQDEEDNNESDEEILGGDGTRPGGEDDGGGDGFSP